VSKSGVKRPSRLERWEAAVPLGFACFSCLGRDALRKYQTNNSDHARAALRHEMKHELLRRLADGKLTALALLEGAPPDEGPVPIPRHLIPTDDREVDWDRDSLTSAGHNYVRIRVSRTRLRIHLSNPPGFHAPEAPGDHESVGSRARRSKTAKQPHPTTIAPTPKKPIGRPRVDGPLLAVVHDLNQKSELVGKYRKEQVSLIRAAARQAHPNFFPKDSQPSVTKIYEALKAEGLIGTVPPVHKV
jgi:hypothetical protein